MLCSIDESAIVVVAHRGIDHGTSCTLSKNSTSGLTGHHNQQRTIEPQDEVAEWLRRWTANPLGSARVGSNPILVEHKYYLAKEGQRKTMISDFHDLMHLTISNCDNISENTP